MSQLDELRAKIAADLFEFSQHALDQSIKRDITVPQVRQAMLTGEIIEDYPDDKYGPSLLIFGRTETDRPLHIQCSYPSRDLIKIVTLYEPDPARWVNFRERKP
jgi:Domain of unknown function (DUF4258)